MILNSQHIADLMDPVKRDANDPLEIAPRPDLKVLRDRNDASVDLRLGCWFIELKHARAPLLDVGKKLWGELSPSALIREHYVRFDDVFILHPRSFVLASTLEWIRLPIYIAGYVTSRSSWGRRGLIIATATGVHPSFTGCLTLELFNSGELPIALHPGMTICQFFMHLVQDPRPINIEETLACHRKPFLNVIELDPIAKKIAGIHD